MKLRLHNLFLITVAISSCGLSGCASIADWWLNDVTLSPPYTASNEALELHKSLIIVDLHADPLLWERDLLTRNQRGHVDLPRLQDGNVALQVFGVVTGVPFPLRMENNEDKNDLITFLAKSQDWPEVTHDSRLQRALFQAKRLHDRAQDSQGKLQLIKTRADLETLIANRQQGKQVIGGLLSLEGTHALEGNPANIDTLYNAGFRMLGLVHLMDIDMAGSAHGVSRHGLTDKGRIMLQRALDLNMIIDLAHASEQTIDDVLEIVDRPVVVSHGGVRATCDTARNLADRHIKAVAKTGGVIGIGIYEYAVCGKTFADTVRAIRHVVNLVGIEYVALGTDFDGATETMVDATGLVLLTEALQKADFSAEEIRAIMGQNAIRVLRSTLPD
jgi:membrane dipeptidase